MNAPSIHDQLFKSLELAQKHSLPRLITERLRARSGGKHVLVTRDSNFRVASYATTGAITRHSSPGHVALDVIGSHDEQLTEHRDSGHETIRWQGHELEHVTLTLQNEMCGPTTWCWLVAPSRDIAEALFREVVEWNSHVHGEVLVFEAGYFSKSKELQDDIASFSLNDLVLQGDLSEALRAEVKQFLISKELYRRVKAPWKRGVLLIGPPGNGKTHAVKAMVRESGLPCIYVKSLSGRRVDPHDTIPEVFERARQLAPCIMVLEDLDSLVDDENRSALLNELDGFARNDGLFTIATTNHPERLDPSLLHRPSRFDRKFQFALPAQGERHRYLERWATSLDAAMRPGAGAIDSAAEATAGFTFAYLKEATISALMQWVANEGSGQTMETVLANDIDGLKKEIAALPPPGQEPPPKPKRPRSPWDW